MDQESIKILTKLAPSIPGQMDAMTHQAMQLSESTETLAATLRERLESAQGRISDLIMRFEEIDGQLVKREDEIRTGVADNEENSKALESTLVTARKMAETDVSSLRERVGHLRQAVEEHQGQHDQVLMDAAAEVKDLEGKAKEDLGEVDQQVQHTDAAIERVRECIDNSKDRTSGSIDAFHDKVEDEQQAFTSKLQETGQQFDGSATDLADKLAQLDGDVIKVAVRALRERTQKMVEDEIKKIIEELMQKLREEIMGLIGRASDSKDEINLIRSAIQPLIEELKALFDPLQNSVDRIRETADNLGVDFD